MILLLVAALLTLAVPAGAGELDMLPLGDPARSMAVAGIAAGTFYDTHAGAERNFDAMVDRMARADVVLLGEEHTHAGQKELQAKILAALAAHGRRVVLGMEFFQRDDAGVLGRFLDGSLEGDEFLLASGWYDRGGYRFDYYRPQMEAARRLHLPIVGLNVPREIVRAVNRGGLAALTPDQRTLIGEVSTAGSPQHRFLVERFFGEAAASMPAAVIDTMYAAQCLWDVAMARSILTALPTDATVVVIVGSGHVAYSLGIARRLAEERATKGLPALDVVTFVPVEAPLPAEEGDIRGHPGASPAAGQSPDASPAMFVRSLADFVGAFAATGGLERYPRLGADLEAGKDGAVTVKRVWPDTPAQHAGLKAGDIVLDLNGATFADLAHLRLALASLEWGERVDVRVRRGSNEVNAVVLLAEDPVAEKQRFVPGWGSETLAGFDPLGSAAATPVAGRTVRMVRRDGVPLRVEERDGTTVVALHALDAAGRAACSLFRDPRPDGTVEACYTREAAGAVTATARFDRTGRPVGNAGAVSGAVRCRPKGGGKR